jgi:hypothetical protein
MNKSQFLRMVGTFIEVGENIQNTTPKQFEQMLKEPSCPLVEQLFGLENEIRQFRIQKESEPEPGKEQKVSQATTFKKKTKTKVSETENKEISKTEETKGIDIKQSKTEETKGIDKQSKTEDTKGIDIKQSKTEDTKGFDIKQSKTEDTKGFELIQEQDKKVSKYNKKTIDKKEQFVSEKKETISEQTVECEPEVDMSTTNDPLFVKKRTIPKHIKTLVWNKHIGANHVNAKCISCKEEQIDCRNFHCGHVLSESNGGDMTINNLRPICSHCNLSMGTRSMNEFTFEFFGWTV